MAIQFNDFLANPTIPPLAIFFFASTFGFIAAGFVGGARSQFFSVFAGAAIFAAALLSFASASQWFIEPSLGIFGVGFLALCNAAIVIQLISGLDSKKGRIAGFGTALAIALLYYPLQTLMSADASLINVFGIFAITILVGSAIGYFVSNIDRRVYTRIGLFTALLSTAPIIVDRFMSEFAAYMTSDAVSGSGTVDLSACVYFQDTVPKTKRIAIGNWNMDSTASKNVAHGMADHSRILSVSVMIISDNSASITELTTNASTLSPAGGNILIDATQFQLSRITGGIDRKSTRLNSSQKSRYT
jgi:hypothetical protein